MNDIATKNQDMLTSSDVGNQVTTAHSYPRNIDNFLRNSTAMATRSEKIAESCGYALPVMNKGKQEYIKGASVRLAEIIAQLYGNLRVSVNILPEEKNTVKAQAIAWDMESNVAIKLEVQKNIVYKNGARYAQSLINTTQNAAASIAYRNAIFKIIPKIFIDDVYDKAMEVAYGKATTSITDRINKAFKYFETKGAYKEDIILKFLNKDKKIDVDIEDLRTLGGIKNSIEDGEVSIENAFFFDSVDTESKDELTAAIKG